MKEKYNFTHAKKNIKMATIWGGPRKVKFLDKSLVKNYFALVAIISVFVTIFQISINFPDKYKIPTILIIFFLLIFYIILWIRANIISEVKLKINNSTVIIKTGDLFKEEGFKVIAFNEYFDTQVDNKVISENTLNGIYLRENVHNTDELDQLISKDTHLKDNILESNDTRVCGKKIKYKLGTIFQHNDYLLTAFTKFDKNNRAYLYINDYVNFLLQFWNEIDIIYAGKSISIPLLGSGITRLKEDNTISEQELLELLILSFKISRIKFTYPSKLSIIIHESKSNKINFYKLKECSNGLQKW